MLQTNGLLGGAHVYPSREEAEYSAALVLLSVVAVSWWAGRVGRAVLRVPCVPQTESAGRRGRWLDLDPRGLQPLDFGEAVRVPRRRRLTEEMLKDGLPVDPIYVGPGHHRRRLQRSKWSPPFLPCRPSCVMGRLGTDLHPVDLRLTSGCARIRGEAARLRLAYGGLCEADMLAVASFLNGPSQQSEQRSGKFHRTTGLVL